MKPKLLLRLASIVVIFHDMGHTFGAVTWRQSPDPVKQSIINQMIEHKSPFMGTIRSMGEYYEGYGYAATIALLLIGVILWLASGVSPQNLELVKKILVAIGISLLLWGADELIFFFPFAAAFSLLASLLTFLAVFNLKGETK